MGIKNNFPLPTESEEMIQKQQTTVTENESLKKHDTYPQYKTDRLMNGRMFFNRLLKRSADKSYQNLNPGQFKEGSREWLLAMLNYAMEMCNADKIRDDSINKVKH